MNIRNVLKVYGLLRQFSDDETALLETLRKFTDAEREAFVEALQPPMTTRSYQKQGSERCGHRFELSGALCNRMAKNATHHDKNLLDYHKFESRKAGNKSASKSPRASALESQLKASIDIQRQAKSTGLSTCTFIVNPENSEPCRAAVDDPVHDLSYSSAHEFVVGGQE